jgi:hypothetical protein
MVVMTSPCVATPSRRPVGRTRFDGWFDDARGGAIETRTPTMNATMPSWFVEELTVATELLRL